MQGRRRNVEKQTSSRRSTFGRMNISSPENIFVNSYALRKRFSIEIHYCQLNCINYLIFLLSLFVLYFPASLSLIRLSSIFTTHLYFYSSVRFLSFNSYVLSGRIIDLFGMNATESDLIILYRHHHLYISPTNWTVPTTLVYLAHPSLIVHNASHSTTRDSVHRKIRL